MVSNKHVKWLYDESKLWEADGLIEPQQASSIRARYADLTGMSWGLYILSALGAVVFGLGVILFFAYNWSDLHKFVKLALIFAALIVSHAAALYINVKTPSNRNLVEAFHMLGTMMFGAGIWLIAQIYHIDEHYPTAFAVWGLGALLMAWVMPSVLQGILASVILCAWGLSEIIDFSALHWLSSAVVFVGVVGLAYQQRSRVLLFVGVVSMLMLFSTNVISQLNENITYFMFFSIGILLIAVARLARFSQFPESGDVFRTIGIVIYGFLLFITTFEFFAIEIIQHIPDGEDFSVSVSFLSLAALAWCLLAWDFMCRDTSIVKRLEIALVGVAIVVVLLFLLGVFENTGPLGFLIFNAVLAAHCVLLIIVGTDELNWRHVAVGCLTLTLLIFWRFNDLFQSLLMRSLVFLVVGAILLFVGHIHSKKNALEKADA